MLKSLLFVALEGCESGLIGSLGKRRVAKAARGFEPLSLRQEARRFERRRHDGAEPGSTGASADTNR
ncbi:MAG: hypothetical protein UV89_C0035G0002 [candidate division WWE3 bacterium GW2011_GWB2_43_22]|uniref:Uncharacterized protein n=1 Tax=candidate division WWE3 bacterium GW2011_GWB2_43_22 TaxID=1619118 RepID=A0A0G1GQ26_UNCKA|nr:MAG: hypothetical protein UV89_C0035G0002 [candidate division WWE3 bacterium GW2011_GWB2_43_22]